MCLRLMLMCATIDVLIFSCFSFLCVYMSSCQQLECSYLQAFMCSTTEVQAAAHMVCPGLLHTGPLPIPLLQWWHGPPVSLADPTPLCPLLVDLREGLAATAAHCRRSVIPAHRVATQ